MLLGNKTTGHADIYYVRMHVLRQTSITCALFAFLQIFIGCASQPPTQNDLQSDEKQEALLNSPIPGYQAPETLEEAIRRGDAAKQSGDAERAIFEYTQGLELSDDPSQLYTRLAIVNHELGNTTPAGYAARKALEFSPENATAHQILGHLFLNQKYYAEARNHFNTAIDSSDKFIKNGVPDTETTTPEALNEGLHARFSALTGLGVLNDLEQNFEAAEEKHLAAIALRPRSALARNNYGYSLYLQEQYDKAMQQYQLALKARPKHKLVWRNIGLLLLKQDRINEAEEAFLQVLAPNEAYNDLGYLLMVAGRLDEARMYFEKAIESVNYYYEPAYKNLEVLERRASRQ